MPKPTEIKPYNEAKSTKKQEVTRMFDGIAKTYDLLNHTLSAGIDHYWRWRTVRGLRPYMPEKILDVATGTGDLAVALTRLHPQHIEAVDISPNMIELAKQKFARKSLDIVISAAVADSEALPYPEASFDAITVGFGVRNFGDLDLGLSELARVMKTGGVVAILEFSQPHNFPVKQLFGWYSRVVIPALGRLISKDEAAYTYLPESAAAFPEGTAFAARLERAGFTDIDYKRLTFGVVSVYKGVKR